MEIVLAVRMEVVVEGEVTMVAERGAMELVAEEVPVWPSSMRLCLFLDSLLATVVFFYTIKRLKLLLPQTKWIGKYLRCKVFVVIN